jgi:hypothetical protein
MVEKQRPRSGSRFSLKPQIAAALSAIPPLGYKAPPQLIGGKTKSSSEVLMLRARNYAKAYKTLSVKEWNSYVVFGIQQFSNPSKYLAIRDSESSDETNLRLGRYYRLHLENNAPVDKYFMSQIIGIEAALQTSFPGYFDLSVCEMDEYVTNMISSKLHAPIDISPNSSHPHEPTEVQQDIEMSTEAEDQTNDDDDDEVPLDIQSVSVTVIPSKVSVPILQSPVSPPETLLPITQDFQAAAPTLAYAPTQDCPIHDDNDKQNSPTTLASSSPTSTPNLQRRTKTTSQKDPTTPPPVPVPILHRPLTASSSVRIEARWAPKDFHVLKSSTAQMYTRLAPLLSSFNTSHSWMIEWQNDQLAPERDLSSAQLSKFLSIRVVPVLAQQCLYFSFRVNATGKQLVQVLQSKELKKKKRGGENLTLDPSFIPAHQGELVFIGDILLKDASVMHRSKYLKYLRNVVLPPDVPSFDIKVRHKDPAGGSGTLASLLYCTTY